MEEPHGTPVAVGRIPSGLYVITATHAGVRQGYLASWVQQASFAPLLISISIKPGRPCYDLIKASGCFCVNVIGQNNGGVMKPFWNPSAEDPFTGLEHSVTERGSLVLANALAALECETRSTAIPGDHEILFAEVVASQILHPEDKPLTHVRKNGLSY